MNKFLSFQLSPKQFAAAFIVSSASLIIAALSALLPMGLTDKVGIDVRSQILPHASAAATDMFLKISGIEGEAKDHVHQTEIDVLSWSWGMSQAGSSHTGSGRDVGMVNVQDLSLTKYIDKATTDLMLHCCGGKHISEAKLTVRKAGGDKPLEYLIITMKDVMVTSISAGGSSGEDRLTENVTLNFSKIKVEYQEYDEKGNPVGVPKVFERGS